MRVQLLQEFVRILKPRERERVLRNLCSGQPNSDGAADSAHEEAGEAGAAVRPEQLFKLGLMTMGGDTVSVADAHGGMTIKALKQAIFRQTQTPVECQQLFLAGRESALVDQQALGSLGIGASSEVFLMSTPGTKAFDPMHCHSQMELSPDMRTARRVLSHGPATACFGTPFAAGQKSTVRLLCEGGNSRPRVGEAPMALAVVCCGADGGARPGLHLSLEKPTPYACAVVLEGYGRCSAKLQAVQEAKGPAGQPWRHPRARGEGPKGKAAWRETQVGETVQINWPVEVTVQVEITEAAPASGRQHPTVEVRAWARAPGSGPGAAADDEGFLGSAEMHGAEWRQPGAHRHVFLAVSMHFAGHCITVVG